jgi:hypothetical protein
MTTETEEKPLINLETKYPTEGVIQRDQVADIAKVPTLADGKKYVLVIHVNDNYEAANHLRMVREVQRAQSGWYRQDANGFGARYFHGAPINEVPNLGDEVLAIQHNVEGATWVKGIVTVTTESSVGITRLYGPDGAIDQQSAVATQWVRLIMPLPAVFVPVLGDDEATLVAKRKAGGDWLRWHGGLPVLLRETERRGWTDYMNQVANEVGVVLPPAKYKVTVSVTVDVPTSSPTTSQREYARENLTRGYEHLAFQNAFLRYSTTVEFDALEASNGREAQDQVTKEMVVEKVYEKFGGGADVQSFNPRVYAAEVVMQF